MLRKASYEGLEVYGMYYGLLGLVAGDIFKMSECTVGDKIQRGGTSLYSARYPQLLVEEGQCCGVEQLNKSGIEALVVIGGDGLYHGLLALTRVGSNTIGLPGTIDNDISYTDSTIGFDTAVNTVVEAVDRCWDTALSHERTFVFEVMGREAGDIALWSGVLGGAEDVFIPEHDSDVKKMLLKLQSLRERGVKQLVICLAEGVSYADVLL